MKINYSGDFLCVSVNRKHLTERAIIIYNSFMKFDSEFERRLNFNLLYDFYSPLLTVRQRRIYELVCFSDMSLGEAAESLGISRQAVHMMKRKIEAKLEAIENDLHFADTTRKFEERIKSLEMENEFLRSKLGLSDKDIK